MLPLLVSVMEPATVVAEIVIGSVIGRARPPVTLGSAVDWDCRVVL